jgi:hypothetical protein
VVERASLESLYTSNRIVGSNPTLSANQNKTNAPKGALFVFSRVASFRSRKWMETNNVSEQSEWHLVCFGLQAHLKRDQQS